MRYAQGCAYSVGMTIAPDTRRAKLDVHRGDWLRKAMDFGGVTAAEIAELIDVSSRTMTNYLGGHTKPKKRALNQIALRTGVPLSYLESGILPDGWVPPTLPSDFPEEITEVLLASDDNVIPMFPALAEAA